ncbi:MAG TPA: hypothetical protein VLY04_18685 [Bryobacteraceae bacterium]|nr:hypothetical protein [Bryobacteraceae bacterium]
MKKLFLVAAGSALIVCPALAQAPQEGPLPHDQQSVERQTVVVRAGHSEALTAGMVGPDGRLGMLNVTGKPFSATETRRTLQVLANGARIEHSDSNLIYRDDQGRTRAEQTFDGKTVVVIMDPVSKSVFILDRESKTARKSSIPANANRGAVSVVNGGVTMQWAATTSSSQSGEAHAVPPLSGTELRPRIDWPGAAARRATEDLGTLLVNGVMAQGTRETLTIPAHQIGNDRDLQVVNESWYASDLQMLIKSVNSDPRFGETTYQLSNIVRAPQDPSLFQVPADYTITESIRVVMQ